METRAYQTTAWYLSQDSLVDYTANPWGWTPVEEGVPFQARVDNRHNLYPLNSQKEEGDGPAKSIAIIELEVRVNLTKLMEKKSSPT